MGLGDSNMVDVRVDKSSHCSTMISRREHCLFNALKEVLNIHKPTRKDKDLRYTWKNLRLNGVRVFV